MEKIVISGTGLFTPPESISNAELVASFNEYVNYYNHVHHSQIEEGKLIPLELSDAEFIQKASGIKNRYVMNKAGILDIKIMCPQIPERDDADISVQCEMALVAAKQAMENAKKAAADIDAVIVSCTDTQRPYPAIAIEAQNALGIKGFAYDMGAACSSVTFGIQTAVNAIRAGSAKCVLLLNPELASPQLDYRDRESHFIFGDVATAMVIEKAETCNVAHAFEIIATKLQTQFSNHIRSNLGFVNRAERAAGAPFIDKTFGQQGRKVFKEVIPWADEFISSHLNEFNLKPEQLRRLWLHQANINMNRLIGTKLLGYEPDNDKAPIILDEYANTGSGGVGIAFHKYHEDMQVGDLGVLSSFGAGYSIGSVILKKHS